MIRGRFLAAFLSAWLLCVSGCNRDEPPATAGRARSSDRPAPVQAGAPGTIDPATDGGEGVFRGRVVLKGPAPERKKLLVVKDGAVCGRIDHLDDRLVVGEGGRIRYAVVSVAGVREGKGIGALGKEFLLNQQSCAYSPRVLLVPVGATLKILNRDEVLHNIHTFSRLNKPFNVAQPKVLRELKRTFTVPERITVRCDVHGWMCAWVIVVDHPYHAITDEAGRFEITGIPPGEYTVVCWQEELGEQSYGLTITAADGRIGNASHDFVYSIDTLRRGPGGAGPGL